MSTRFASAGRVPRDLHPVAWWLWAIGMGTTASATTNPVLLMLVLAVLAVVVVNRRQEAPWARAFKYFLYMALAAIALRVVLRAVFGGDVTPKAMHVIVTLPHLSLPSWAAGVQLGGAVTAQGIVQSLYTGMRLGTLLCCLGAANALANPKRALRVLPGALYELGMAVVVALSVAPQLVEGVQRAYRARKLRGDTSRRLRAVRSVAIPVLEDAVERSLRLAASMDARGYGRTANATVRSRRVTAGFMVVGMSGLCLGAYGLLDGSHAASLGYPGLVAGGAACTAGLIIGGRRVRRTRYRPDPWRLPEWTVVLAGVLPAVVLLAGVGISAVGLRPPTQPLSWPTFPLVAVLALVAGITPALAAPPPPLRPAPARRGDRPVADAAAGATPGADMAAADTLSATTETATGPMRQVPA